MDSIVVTDKSGRIVECNHLAEKMFGREREEIINENIKRLISPRRCKQIGRRRQEHFFDPGVDPCEVVVEHALSANGRRIPVQITAVPTGKGDAQSVLFFLRDMPEPRGDDHAGLLNRHSGTPQLIQTIESILQAIDLRDPYTGSHQRRVAHLGRAIAVELGFPQSKIDAIYLGGLLHDIGKNAIPLGILFRPGPLDQTNLKLIRQHCFHGYEIIKHVNFPWQISKIILQHHERLDGTGYPNGLTASQIIAEAKVIAVADVVEAMSSHRPHRPSLGFGAALCEVTGKPQQYDRAVATACQCLFHEKGYRLQQYRDKKLSLV